MESDFASLPHVLVSPLEKADVWRFLELCRRSPGDGFGHLSTDSAMQLFDESMDYHGSAAYAQGDMVAANWTTRAPGQNRDDGVRVWGCVTDPSFQNRNLASFLLKFTTLMVLRLPSIGSAQPPVMTVEISKTNLSARRMAATAGYFGENEMIFDSSKLPEMAKEFMIYSGKKDFKISGRSGEMHISINPQGTILGTNFSDMLHDLSQGDLTILGYDMNQLEPGFAPARSPAKF